MEETATRNLRNGERGSALVVVLMALVVMLPLALLLMTTAFRAQRQAQSMRDLTALDYAVRAGFADAHLRLAERRIDLAPRSASSYQTVVDDVTVRVRVERQQDAVLSLDGRVLTGSDADEADVDAKGFDPTMRPVHQFQRLEVFLVESRADQSGLPTVRLSAVLVRAGSGPLQQAGLVVERGYFDKRFDRGLELANATRVD